MQQGLANLTKRSLVVTRKHVRGDYYFEFQLDLLITDCITRSRLSLRWCLPRSFKTSLRVTA